MQAGYPVLFGTGMGWADRLTTAHAEGRLDKELKWLRRYRTLIINEVGYLPFETEQANQFFQLIASRYEQGSILITSNMPFGRWDEIFGDDIVASAMIDRLVRCAEVLSLSGDSYFTRVRRELPATGAEPASSILTLTVLDLSTSYRRGQVSDIATGSIFTRR